MKTLSGEELLPHIISSLNERDWELRASFFENISHVAICVGQVKPPAPVEKPESLVSNKARSSKFWTRKLVSKLGSRSMKGTGSGKKEAI